MISVPSSIVGARTANKSPAPLAVLLRNTYWPKSCSRAYDSQASFKEVPGRKHERLSPASADAPWVSCSIGSPLRLPPRLLLGRADRSYGEDLVNVCKDEWTRREFAAWLAAPFRVGRRYRNLWPPAPALSVLSPCAFCGLGIFRGQMLSGHGSLETEK